MPDLVTHFAAAYFVSHLQKVRQHRVSLYMGTILPDLISRPVYILFPRLYPYTVALHTPVFLILFSLFYSQFFAKSIRKDVFLFTVSGMALHFGLDLFQRHTGSGYLWLFPLSWNSFEIGLYWPEQPLLLTPLWVLLILIIETVIRLRRI